MLLKCYILMIILFLILVTFFFARFICNLYMVFSCVDGFVCHQRRFSVLLTLTRSSLNLDAVVMLQNPSLYSVRSIRLQKNTAVLRLILIK